jgi:hypothetical protein
MDPISIGVGGAASFITIYFALKPIYEQLRDFAKSMIYASEEIKRLARKVSDFSDLLLASDETFKEVTASLRQSIALDNVIKSYIEQAEEIVDGLRDLLWSLKPLLYSRHNMTLFVIQTLLARFIWTAKKRQADLLSSKQDSILIGLNLAMSVTTIKKLTEEVSRLSGSRGEEVDNLQLQVEELRDRMYEQTDPLTFVSYLILTLSLVRLINLKYGAKKEELEKPETIIERYSKSRTLEQIHLVYLCIRAT